MKVLLIGGSGFIGPATAAALQKSGHHVTVFQGHGLVWRSTSMTCSE